MALTGTGTTSSTDEVVGENAETGVYARSLLVVVEPGWPEGLCGRPGKSEVLLAVVPFKNQVFNIIPLSVLSICFNLLVVLYPRDRVNMTYRERPKTRRPKPPK
jgi:hypothetical protein